MRRGVLVAAVAAASLVVLQPSGGAAPAAGPGSPSPPGDRPVGHAAPHGDRDGDRVDDAFEPTLRAASADRRLDVVVTGLGVPAARALVGRFDVRHRLALVDGFSATMTAGQARGLSRRPEVRRVEAVTPMHTMDDGGNRDFGVVDAHADRPGLDGSGVGICVVDTGIDPGHEQIAPRAVGFADFIGTGTTAYDDHGHGTHVASIAAGDGTGGSSAPTFAGVAPAASLYAAKVLDSSGSGPNDGVVAGIEWCARQPGVDVISLSLGDPAGGDGTDVVSLAVDTAVEQGEVVVAAAGNSGDGPGTIASPGTAVGSITVGAVSEHSSPTGTDRRDDGIWLAAFSSRGPVGDRIKPDLVAPGVTVRAADAGTTAGYATFSGTSMATPFVSGAVALGLEAVPAATPAQVRSALSATAKDVGAVGTDNEWGSGLIDVRAFVDQLSGASDVRRTPMPAFAHVAGSVPDHGSTLVPIEVSADGLGVPLAVTVTLDGTGGCVYLFGVCWPSEWSPDLDVELLDPSGSVVATSACALSGLSCGTGRQETVAVVPGAVGTWQLRVYTFEGGPDDGAGGSFVADISRGPLAGTVASEPPPDPEPVPNAAPVADAGDDVTVKPNRKTKQATFTLDGSGSTDADGSIVGWAWVEGGAVVGTSPQVTLERPEGTWTFELTVTDDDGATGTDTVVVTVGGSGGGSGGGGGKGGGPKG